MKGKTMTKKTMTTEDASSIISEVITFYFEIRGKTDDKKEIKWREKILEAEHIIAKELTKQQKAA